MVNKQYSKGFLKTRRGAITVSVIAGVLAAVILAIYLQSVRTTVPTASLPNRVLVATRLIPRGTSAATIVSDHLYTVTTVQSSQLQLNAIGDPSALDGRLAAGDIYPGQQLTQQDFTTENAATALPEQLTGAQRAIAVTVDQIHGMLGQIAAGDYIDVYVEITATQATATTAKTPAAATQVRLLMPDILVLSTPSATSPDMILRVGSNDAAEFAYASDFDRLWFVLRPLVGATPTPPEVATVGTLLGRTSR
jgi:Flp pilus assembly protein CpaB